MYPSLYIWTKVSDEEYDVSRSGVSYDLVKQFSEDKITIHELVNEVFEPCEQVSEIQANLLGQAFILACGGEGQIRVGTGSGGSQFWVLLTFRLVLLEYPLYYDKIVK